MSKITLIEVKSQYFIPEWNAKVIVGTDESIRIMLSISHGIELFYTEAIEPKELNLYDTLNIKYINQIICSKR